MSLFICRNIFFNSSYKYIIFGCVILYAYTFVQYTCNHLVILILFCSIEVYGMKTDVIKEALESVKKEDPKLYEDVVEFISSNRNKTGVHPEGVYHEHSWPNIIGPMPGPFPHPRNPFEQNPFGVFWPLAGLYLFYKLVRKVWRLLRGKNQNISLDDIITYINNHK